MKLTIIKDDGAVYVDGLSYANLVLNSIPANVHALQWDGLAGHIEYIDLVNETIDALPTWALNAINIWNEANQAYQIYLIEQAKLNAPNGITEVPA